MYGQFLAHNGFTLRVTRGDIKRHAGKHFQCTLRALSLEKTFTIPTYRQSRLPQAVVFDKTQEPGNTEDHSLAWKEFNETCFDWRACTNNSFPPTVLQFHTNSEIPVATRPKSRSPAVFDNMFPSSHISLRKLLNSRQAFTPLKLYPTELHQYTISIRFFLFQTIIQNGITNR